MSGALYCITSSPVICRRCLVHSSHLRSPGANSPLASVIMDKVTPSFWHLVTRFWYSFQASSRKCRILSRRLDSKDGTRRWEYCVLVGISWVSVREYCFPMGTSCVSVREYCVLVKISCVSVIVTFSLSYILFTTTCHSRGEKELRFESSVGDLGASKAFPETSLSPWKSTDV